MKNNNKYGLHAYGYRYTFSILGDVLLLDYFTIYHFSAHRKTLNHKYLLHVDRWMGEVKVYTYKIHPKFAPNCFFYLLRPKNSNFSPSAKMYAGTMYIHTYVIAWLPMECLKVSYRISERTFMNHFGHYQVLSWVIGLWAAFLKCQTMLLRKKKKWQVVGSFQMKTSTVRIEYSKSDKRR